MRRNTDIFSINKSREERFQEEKLSGNLEFKRQHKQLRKFIDELMQKKEVKSGRNDF